MKKRLIALLTMLFLLTATTAFALSASPGETIQIPITLNNTDGCYIAISVSYDTSVFDYVSIQCPSGQATGTKMTMSQTSVWPSGVCGTLTLKVKDTAVNGTYSINAKVTECWNIDEDYPAFGEMMVEDITPTDIQVHLNNCQHLAKESQQKQINVLRMILDMAVEDGFILLNPSKSKKVHLTSQAHSEREPLTREEMLDAISRIPCVVKPLDRCFIAIQALHGMRPCEVLGLKWEDLDLEKGLIHIRRNVVHPTRNFPVTGDTKTKLSKRSVAISQIALPYIQEAKMAWHRAEDFVFGGETPLSYTQHRKLMYRINKQMGLKGVTGYTFRHTIITDIYEITHDANIAAAVAGHSKTTTTMNRYAHARRDAAKKGILAVDAAYNL